MSPPTSTITILETVNLAEHLADLVDVEHPTELVRDDIKMTAMELKHACQHIKGTLRQKATMSNTMRSIALTDEERAKLLLDGMIKMPATTGYELPADPYEVDPAASMTETAKRLGRR